MWLEMRMIGVHRVSLVCVSWSDIVTTFLLESDV